jgi:hypothetical protein
VFVEQDRRQGDRHEREEHQLVGRGRGGPPLHDEHVEHEQQRRGHDHHRERQPDADRRGRVERLPAHDGAQQQQDGADRHPDGVHREWFGVADPSDRDRGLGRGCGRADEGEHGQDRQRPGCGLRRDHRDPGDREDRTDQAADAERFEALEDRQQQCEERHRSDDHRGDARRHPLRAPEEESESEGEGEDAVECRHDQLATARQPRPKDPDREQREESGSQESKGRAPERIQLSRHLHHEDEVRAAEHHHREERDEDTSIARCGHVDRG